MLPRLELVVLDWIRSWVPTLPKKDSATLAAVGVNGILGPRFATKLFHQAKQRIPDDQYLAEWTALMAARLDKLE